MLNIYDYYDRPKRLPLFHSLGHRMRLLDDWDLWDIKISADELKPLLGIISRDSKLAFMYAHKILRGRFKEAEQYIMRKPSYASMYAEFILSKDPEWTSQLGHENGRWPEAEPYIMKDSYSAYNYAKGVIKGRWIEAEPFIKKDKDDWWKYTREFGVE